MDTIAKENLRMEKELKYLGSEEYINELVDAIMKKQIELSDKAIKPFFVQQKKKARKG